jgi:hypothetical protein
VPAAHERQQTMLFNAIRGHMAELGMIAPQGSGKISYLRRRRHRPKTMAGPMPHNSRTNQHFGPPACGDDARIGIETGAMTPWDARNRLSRCLACACRPQDADQQDGSERRRGISSDRSHWLVPVRSRQVVRKPPLACSSGRRTQLEGMTTRLSNHTRGVSRPSVFCQARCGDCHSIERLKL